MKWAAASSTPTFVGCSLWHNSDNSLTNATTTILSFDQELFDTDGFHSTTTNNSRITIPSGKGGKYLFVAHGEIETNGTGARTMAILKNGNLVDQAQIGANANGRVTLPVVTILDAAVGDYFQFGIYQNSGGTLSSYGGASYATVFSAQYLGA